MKLSTAGGVLLFVGLAATAAAQSPSPDVAKVRNAYMAAVHAGDGKAVAALFTDDGVEMPPNHEMLKGRPAIEKYNVGFLSSMSVKLSLTEIESSASGNTAHDVGSYSQTITPKQAGGKPITDRGKYIVLLRRGADGQWRLKYAIYNSDLPTQPMPAAPSKP